MPDPREGSPLPPPPAAGSSIGDTAFRLSLDAIVVMNADGEIVGWNPAAEALFGWPVEEAVGRRVMDLIVPEQLRAPRGRPAPFP